MIFRRNSTDPTTAEQIERLLRSAAFYEAGQPAPDGLAVRALDRWRWRRARSRRRRNTALITALVAGIGAFSLWLAHDERRRAPATWMASARPGVTPSPVTRENTPPSPDPHRVYSTTRKSARAKAVPEASGARPGGPAARKPAARSGPSARASGHRQSPGGRTADRRNRAGSAGKPGAPRKTFRLAPRPQPASPRPAISPVAHRRRRPGRALPSARWEVQVVRHDVTGILAPAWLVEADEASGGWIVTPGIVDVPVEVRTTLSAEDVPGDTGASVIPASVEDE